MKKNNFNSEALSEMPSAQVAVNAGFNGAEFIQHGIKILAGERKGIPCSISFFNKKESGISKIYFTIGDTAPVVAEVNKLQINKLIDFAYTGQYQQLFPLTKEDEDNAAPEDLEPVEDVRAYALSRSLSPYFRTGGRIRVYPYNGDKTKIDLHIKCKITGIILRFYIEKESPMGEMLRKMHIVF